MIRQIFRRSVRIADRSTFKISELSGSSYTLKLDIASKISPDHMHGVFWARQSTVGFRSVKKLAWTQIQENYLNGPDYITVFAFNLILLR